MKNVKMPTSDSYREFLIECLKDPEHAAGYIEAILEEEDPEPELLRNALRKVIEAWEKSDRRLSESTKQLHEKLDRILTESNASEIYTFVELLNALGFQIAISPKETE
ncbi:transcriptional regulator [Phormidium sp. LEGE 05292]|uniref:helix-turn-helix domain-containing transcriptional regulator n=1 Tax=[Phormidium] sp. LEGE 05292 TaxID=767427 RepID=UPI001881D951|nr:transcriptional regulator [Phormidium sp. LEGE 05292]MBE9225027.1 transcriptional regulator [Phormidium sp. LEGE 05292]